MPSDTNIKRFIYPTRGVCPPEIHFKINGGHIEDIRFVGGGCPGNAQLAARLLEGKPIEEVLQSLIGIDCRNNTSCPGQLAAALHEVNQGHLHPAESFRLHIDTSENHQIALGGGIEGNAEILENLIQDVRDNDIETFYLFGNLTGNSHHNKDIIKLIRKYDILAVQGEIDWHYSLSKEKKGMPSMGRAERDWLFQLPQVLSFRLGPKKGVGFFGDYIQSLPDYSDFESFALELNMVCGLADFMQDKTVFPALEAMVPQFQTDIILFSQSRKWGHWQVGGKNFISVGPALEKNRLSWGILELESESIHFKKEMR